MTDPGDALDVVFDGPASAIATEAVSEGLADLGQAAALLRSSPSPDIAAVGPVDFGDVVGGLIEAAGSSPSYGD